MREPTIKQSASEYGRGLAGGLLFSLPMLYTEEVWMRGSAATPGQMLIALGFTFILLLGYNRYAGLRHDASLAEVVIDSVEELGLGLAMSAGLLWLLGRIELQMSVNEIGGRVLLEAMAVAVGVSVGTAQLGASNGNEQNGGSQDEQGQSKDQGGSGSGKEQGNQRSLGGQVVLGACGAFLIVSNIAPTVEVTYIGNQADPWKLVGVGLLSLALAGGVLYFSNFIGSFRKHGDPLDLFEVLSGTVLTYVVALAICAFILWFFGRFDQKPLHIILAYIVTAGLPAALGASAGRLLLQS